MFRTYQRRCENLMVFLAVLRFYNVPHFMYGLNIFKLTQTENICFFSSPLFKCSFLFSYVILFKVECKYI